MEFIKELANQNSGTVEESGLTRHSVKVKIAGSNPAGSE